MPTLGVPNAFLFISTVAFLIVWQRPIYDWWLIEQANQRIATGDMYAWTAPQYIEDSLDYVYRYSPLLPYIMTPFLAAGLWVWRAAHFVALLALPRRIGLLCLLAGPFWFDVANANFLTFAFVLAWNALDDKRWAQAGYFALLLLIPRPLMLPVAAWLLWRQPRSRPVALAVIPIVAIATLATGEAFQWAGAIARGGDMIGTKFDWGPSRLIGVWWLPIGITVGAWFTWKGRLGLASIAVSPYLLPYYFLMGLLELRGTEKPRQPPRLSAKWSRSRLS